MKSFVAALCLVASASAGVLPATYLGSPYAYPYNYGYTAASPVLSYAAHGGVAIAHQPIAAAVAPLAGVYAGTYDPSVAYSQLYPVAEPYVHEDIAAEAYVDEQIAAEPYVHEEIEAEPYVHEEIAPEAYVHVEGAPAPAAVPYVHE